MPPSVVVPVPDDGTPVALGQKFTNAQGNEIPGPVAIQVLGAAPVWTPSDPADYSSTPSPDGLTDQVASTGPIPSAPATLSVAVGALGDSVSLKTTATPPPTAVQIVPPGAAFAAAARRR